MTDRLNYVSAGATRAKRREKPMPAVIKAHSALIARLAELKPQQISTFPDPEEFEALAAHLRDVAQAVDAYILALGQDAEENVSGSFDIHLFATPLTDAIEGNALYALVSYAEELRDEMIDEGVV